MMASCARLAASRCAGQQGARRPRPAGWRGSLVMCATDPLRGQSWLTSRESTDPQRRGQSIRGDRVRDSSRVRGSTSSRTQRQRLPRQTDMYASDLRDDYLIEAKWRIRSDRIARGSTICVAVSAGSPATLSASVVTMGGVAERGTCRDRARSHPGGRHHRTAGSARAGGGPRRSATPAEPQATTARRARQGVRHPIRGIRVVGPRSARAAAPRWCRRVGAALGGRHVDLSRQLLGAVHP